MENIKSNYNRVHSELVLKAIYAATNSHNDSNHKYNDASYTVHLAHVVDVAYRFIHLVPVELRPVVIAALWLHDSIEDARMTYNDVKKATNKDVAEIVRAVTNYTRGRNRKERMPDFIYMEIRDTVGATFAKCCDRTANIETGGKVEMYAVEHVQFKKMLYTPELKEMFDYMEYMFDTRATWKA